MYWRWEGDRDEVQVLAIIELILIEREREREKNVIHVMDRNYSRLSMVAVGPTAFPLLGLFIFPSEKHVPLFIL